MKTDKNVAQYLVNKLEAEGVKYVFGYPGEQVLPIYEALRNSKIKHILVRHEQAAAHAADTYARITGNLGVCIATAGPGAMNLVMGVSTAYKDNVPILVITGDVEKKYKGSDSFQDMDINGVFNPITIKSFYSCTPEKLENNLSKIFDYRKNGTSGPFHINIPKDVQNMTMNMKHRIIPKKSKIIINDEDIEFIVDNINSSRKPLVIVGSGVIYANAINEFKDFVDLTQIPVATTFNARGIISENEYINLGMTGNRGTKEADYAAQHADLILAFGCRLSERTVKHIATRNIIQINSNENHQKADLFYNYDIKQFLEIVNKMELNICDNKWFNRIKSQGSYSKGKIKKTELLNPEKVVKTILSKQDDNIRFIYDAGQTPTYFTIHSKVDKVGQIIFPGGFGPMGFSLPASIGASFADDEDVIIVTAGDGSVQMTIEELAVINYYKLPVIIIVVDNGLLGIIKQWQDMNNLPNYQVKLDNPDFVQIAKSYNIDAEKIDSIEKLSLRLDDAIKNKKPYLFHVVVEDMPIPLPK